MNYKEEAWKKISQWTNWGNEEKEHRTDFHELVRRKAYALWERDKKKLIARECPPPKTDDNKKRAEYRQAIYKAIVDMQENKCPYTGKVLHWELIGKWDNDYAKKEGKDYKRKFALLPTVDHKNAEPQPDFIICSWEANDAKNDLTKDEFVGLCRAVVSHADKYIAPICPF